MTEKILISIVVPVYNEQRTVLEILERVNAVKLSRAKLEIVVVDDGSRDRSVELLMSRPDLYTTLICLKKNRGKGAAVKAGLEAATGEYVLFQDADLEYSPTEYPRLIETALERSADVVMGSRFLAPQCVRVQYFSNKVGNRLITFTFNLLFNKTFTDIYTCYMMFRRKLVDPTKLRTLGFEQQAEILATCMAKGRIFFEVPISYHGRDFVEGKKIRARHAIAVLWTILRFRIYFLFIARPVPVAEVQSLPLRPPVTQESKAPVRSSSGK